MKIVITSIGQDKTDKLDTRFGRAKYFIVYDTKDSSFKSFDNQQNLSAAQGAGIQAAQTVVELGAEVLITGHCGPKAFRVLEIANIKVYSSSSECIEEVIQKFQDNKLEQMKNADVEGHW